MALILSATFLFAAALGGTEDLRVDLYFDPYPTPYVSDWETRTDIAALTLTNLGQEDLELRLYVRVENSRGVQVASGWSERFYVQPGGRAVVNSDEMIDYDTVEF
ncbi:MAG TPA: hypothetical protein EYP61_10300, partial [Candidatus Latescibacteria bacterium]|nr:hypothetical protein [Candidatus Latescibacterota bacterium]